MTIADIILVGFLVTGSVMAVLAHHSGHLSDWWSALQRSSRRPPRR